MKPFKNHYIRPPSPLTLPPRTNAAEEGYSQYASRMPMAKPGQSGERAVCLPRPDWEETGTRSLTGPPMTLDALVMRLHSSAPESELDRFLESASSQRKPQAATEAAASWISWDKLIPVNELTLELRVVAVVQFLSKLIELRGGRTTSTHCWLGCLTSEMIRVTLDGEVEFELDSDSLAAGTRCSIQGDFFLAGLLLYEAVMEEKVSDPFTPDPEQCAADVLSRLSELWHPRCLSHLPAVIQRALQSDAAPAWPGLAEMLYELRNALGDGLPTPSAFAREVRRTIGLRESRPTPLAPPRVAAS